MFCGLNTANGVNAVLAFALPDNITSTTFLDRFAPVGTLNVAVDAAFSSASTRYVPVKPVTFDKVCTVPRNTFLSVPVPLSAPVIVVLPDRLYVRLALSVIAPVPRLPVVPPLPTCSVPAVMLVVPVYVLLAARMVVPDPACVRLPVPVIVAPTVVTALRLKVRLALSVTAAAVPRLPVVPPLPTCNVPALIVVLPA